MADTYVDDTQAASEKLVGKTIAAAEFTFRGPDWCTSNDSVRLTFTDGSAVEIQGIGYDRVYIDLEWTVT